jgi:anti-sigma-K factor RskA
VNGHPQFDEEFDLYALGALEGEEKQALESHLRLCAECAAKLEAANGRIALLALAAPPKPVPDAIKERLLRQVRDEAPKAPAVAAPAFLRWLAPALALATVVLLIVAAELKTENHALLQRQTELQADARQLQQEAEREHSVLDLLTASDTVKVTLVSGAAHPVPEGRAFYHPRKGLLFYASNLPALPSGRTYQLWLVPTQGSPISAGVFHVDSLGNGEVLLPKLPRNITAKAFAVTLEPAGGVPQPTGPKVLIGAVS